MSKRETGPTGELADEERHQVAMRRVAGMSAAAFAVGVVVANAAVGGGPMADWKAVDAAAWFAANGERLALANAMIGLTFPALLMLAASLLELARGSRAARLWTTFGALGAAGMVGVFTLVVAGNIAAVHVAHDVTLFEPVWRLHFAAFAINMTVLGIAFLGFSMGAHAAGVIPGWQRAIGLVGSFGLLFSGFANTAVAGGSLAVAPGGIGFLLWLVWLVLFAFRLLRRAGRLGDATLL